MNRISSCDENRLQVSEDARKNFAEGKKLSAAGKYKKALACLLIAFDNGRYVDGWGGVRLSYVPSEIARLGKKYPPALAALRDRRDAREALIRGGEAVDFDVVHEWLALNRCLGDGARMLKFLTEADESLRRDIVRENFDELLADKQYQLASEVLDDIGERFFHWEFMYEVDKHFPSHTKPGRRESLLEGQLNSMRRTGLQVFELALAVKRRVAANEVARRVLLHCGEVTTYKALIKIANELDSEATARALLKKAKENLSAEDFQRVSKALKA